LKWIPLKRRHHSPITTTLQGHRTRIGWGHMQSDSLFVTPNSSSERENPPHGTPGQLSHRRLAAYRSDRDWPCPDTLLRGPGFHGGNASVRSEFRTNPQTARTSPAIPASTWAERNRRRRMLSDAEPERDTHTDEGCDATGADELSRTGPVCGLFRRPTGESASRASSATLTPWLCILEGLPEGPVSCDSRAFFIKWAGS
jgi:hypothetical protein